MFAIDYEPETEFLVVRIVGPWTDAEVERYGQEIRAAVPRARSRAGSLRMLIDATFAGQVAPEFVNRLARTRNSVSAPDDRVAGIVSSSMTKMVMRNTLQQANWKLFISGSAARTWLSAYEPTRRMVV